MIPTLLITLSVACLILLIAVLRYKDEADCQEVRANRWVTEFNCNAKIHNEQMAELRKELKEAYLLPREQLKWVGTARADIVEYSGASFPTLNRIRLNRDCKLRDGQEVYLMVTPFS